MLFINSESIIGVTYLLPVALLVTATLPVTLVRVLRHGRVTHQTVAGALCTYVLLGLLFAFLFLAVAELGSGPFFAQAGEHQQSEYLYFSFVTLTTLGFGDLCACGRAAAGTGRAGGAARAGVPGHAGGTGW